MMPKQNKVIKKGYDPPGNNYIALGTKKESTSSMSTSSSGLNLSSLAANSESSGGSMNRSPSSNLLSQSVTSTLISTSNITSTNSGTQQHFIDVKTIKEDVTKMLEKERSDDETNEKLVKTVKALVMNIKASAMGTSTNVVLANNVNKLNQTPNDLNYLIALSYIALKRPQLFLNQMSLVEFMCTQLLFSSVFKTGATGPASTSSTVVAVAGGHKVAKSLQQQQLSKAVHTQVIQMQSTICNILYFIFENESTWPDVFVRAYIDDSVTYRNWVDASVCKEFVDNIRTGFYTKQIPASSCMATAASTAAATTTPDTTTDPSKIMLVDDDESITTTSLEVVGGFNLKKSQITRRYGSTKEQIKQLIIEAVKSYMNATATTTKLQQPSSIVPIKRVGSVITTTATAASSSQPTTTATTAAAAAATAAANLVDTKHFIKFLQNICGIDAEIRTLCLSKIDAWLLNPKLEPNAQDLLMAICVNSHEITTTNATTENTSVVFVQQIIKIKPKLKQNQHYFECIRELVKHNESNLEALIQLSVRNELMLQPQVSIQQQQQQQQQPPKNQHCLNLLQIAFASDGKTASKILAQTMQKQLLQRNGDEYARSMRVLLRDIIRNSRNDFDLLQYTNELINDELIKANFFQQQQQTTTSSTTAADSWCDFSGQAQTRERYVISICDLITTCVLVAITPQIKEAYQKAGRGGTAIVGGGFSIIQNDETSTSSSSSSTLIKYYMLMSRIQSDTVTWLQTIVSRSYEINVNELIKCLFKVLFMVDKPEQYYTIDNWPSEQERATLFRVVSEIPVLSDTLHQVLLLTKYLPEPIFMLMLCVEENLLKTCALVHCKNIYSLKLANIDSFIQLLFNICLYRVKSPPSLAVTVLYWKAWQILLILAALDPKSFGQTAWDHYPTLRLLMEMTMLDDYNFPPQSSITDENSAENYIAAENQACLNERQEILDFENSFNTDVNSMTTPVARYESNSKLIGQVMNFDPNGPARRPNAETLANIKKLSSEYKLGQLLCKSRQPDFLLSLIQRQTTKQSLPWLSSLIESSSDCLEIMPIQCVCEIVWNLLSTTEEEITLKRQINPEQLLNRIKLILLSPADFSEDRSQVAQITGIFEYFLEKLAAEKQSTRNCALKILNKLFLTTPTPLLIPPLPDDTTNNNQPITDLNELLDAFKKLNSYETCVQELVVKHFRQAIRTETNLDYLNVYVKYLIEQSLNNMIIKNETTTMTKTSKQEDYNNEVARDLANFLFERDFYYFNSIVQLFSSNIGVDRDDGALVEYALEMLKLNEIDLEKANLIKKKQQIFDRNNLDSNAYVLIEQDDKHIYIHETQFNLLIYLIMIVVGQQLNGSSCDDKRVALFECVRSFKYLNCQFETALNDLVKHKIMTLDVKSSNEDPSLLDSSKLVAQFIELILSSNTFASSTALFAYLIDTYGLSTLSSSSIINKLVANANKSTATFANELDTLSRSRPDTSIDYLIELIKSYDPSRVEFLECLVKLQHRTMMTTNDENKQMGEKLFSSCRKIIQQKTEANSKISEIRAKIEAVSLKIHEQCERKGTTLTTTKMRAVSVKMEVEKNMDVKTGDGVDISSLLIDTINESTNQNLEVNLAHKLESFKKSSASTDHISLLIETILMFENNEELNRSLTTEEATNANCQIVQETRSSSIFSTTTKSKRSVIDILLDFYCHYNPQIVSKQSGIEFRLLFELRLLANEKTSENKFQLYSSDLTQSFLLSLFIHQANWKKLFDCVQYLLNFYLQDKYRYNPTIVLDFLSSLIHIPELWKGTETRILQKYNEENVLNLNEKQICTVIDYIIDEMLKYNNNNSTISQKESTANASELINSHSQTLTMLTISHKRIQLLVRFFKNNNVINKTQFFNLILDHLKKQREQLNRFSIIIQNPKNSITDDDYYTMRSNFINSMQRIILFAIYTEDDSIMNHIDNPDRIFSNLYNQINQPTSLDLKAHNLLNCFGEVDVNYSNNLTSSGIIGVASGAGYKKQQEKQEIIMYVKKQEAFMIDANLVLVKLACTHPYMFIRQLSMMEGLLQGRVAYTFEEFKRRKFDKLFHYIIDILNNIVPFLFHANYMQSIVAIISHYFDVFMSYSSDNKEFIGSLGIKFIEFLEKFILCDLKCGNITINQKYSQFMDYLLKSYPEMSSLKNFNCAEAIPFDDAPPPDSNEEKELCAKKYTDVNILNKKNDESPWSSNQLELFIYKLTDRDNYEGMICVLQELETISQRDTSILSHFSSSICPLILDNNDTIRELSLALLMRHLRLNPKETISYVDIFAEALSSSSSRVFTSALKILSEIVLLCPEKSNCLIGITTRNSSKHNVDATKVFTDLIRILTLEKYVY